MTAGLGRDGKNNPEGRLSGKRNLESSAALAWANTASHPYLTFMAVDYVLRERQPEPGPIPFLGGEKRLKNL